MIDKIQGKREREKRTVALMIRLYCRKKHGTKKNLCPECEALSQYAMQRSDKCPFMETKTFCSNCRVHCYKPEMREKIREVMRFSGPRMILHHPVMLPALPFLLLAAFSFGKSSERLHKWFIGTKLYKNNLESYVKGQGMTLYTKIKVMVTVTLLMAFGFFMMFRKDLYIPCAILGGVWLFHIVYFIWGVKTYGEC